MIWDTIQAIGAVVGLLTGLFVLYERLTQGRPEMFVVAVTSRPDLLGVPRFFHLRVINNRARPLLLRVSDGYRLGEMKISRNDSLRAFVNAVAGSGTSTFIVEGNDQVDFPIVKPPNFRDMLPESQMDLTIEYKFAQPTLWQAWMRKRLSITKRAYLDLAQNEEDEVYD